MKNATKMLIFAVRDGWGYEYVYEFQPHDSFKMSTDESGSLSVNIHPGESPAENALFSLPVEESKNKAGVLSAFREKKISEKEKKELLLYGKLRELTDAEEKLPQ